MPPYNEENQYLTRIYKVVFYFREMGLQVEVHGSSEIPHHKVTECVYFCGMPQR